MKKKNRQNRRMGALKRLDEVKEKNERQQREIDTLKKRLMI